VSALEYMEVRSTMSSLTCDNDSRPVRYLRRLLPTPMLFPQPLLSPFPHHDIYRHICAARPAVLTARTHHPDDVSSSTLSYQYLHALQPCPAAHELPHATRAMRPELDTCSYQRDRRQTRSPNEGSQSAEARCPLSARCWVGRTAGYTGRLTSAREEAHNQAQTDEGN